PRRRTRPHRQLAITECYRLRVFGNLLTHQVAPVAEDDTAREVWFPSLLIRQTRRDSAQRLRVPLVRPRPRPSAPTALRAAGSTSSNPRLRSSGASLRTCGSECLVGKILPRPPITSPIRASVS